MGLAVFSTALILIPQVHASFGKLLGGVLGTILMGIGSYAVCAYLIKSPEVHDLAKMIGRHTTPHEQGSK
jgi:hypothetical protein